MVERNNEHKELWKHIILPAVKQKKVSAEIYEGVLLLKQGFYNYKYVVKNKDQVNKNFFSGSNALAENDYLILVYYRSIGQQHDELIGVGQTNSFQLNN